MKRYPVKVASLASAQSAKIIGRSRHDVGAKLKGQSANGLAVEAHVEIHDRVAGALANNAFGVSRYPRAHGWSKSIRFFMSAC